MIPQHIKEAQDLVTSKEATTQGFIEQSREKIRLADFHIESAKKLESYLDPLPKIEDCLKDQKFLEHLLSAVGVSEKAMHYLQQDQQITIVSEALKTLQQRCPQEWKRELVLRFMLTKGDSLGGTSRNLTGSNAKAAFAKSIEDALKNRGVEYDTKLSKDNKVIRAIIWDKRKVLFDRNSSIVGKNIDLIMLNGTLDEDENILLTNKERFVACGEIKGGIDPAGADEHWKTANTALDRVRTSFGYNRPVLFFAAAAIVQKMATEIVAQLRNNQLNFAANMTKQEQVKDLADWMINL